MVLDNHTKTPSLVKLEDKYRTLTILDRKFYNCKKYFFTNSLLTYSTYYSRKWCKLAPFSFKFSAAKNGQVWAAQRTRRKIKEGLTCVPVHFVLFVSKMVLYNFKAITVVPTAKDFVDIVLSKTQRKTPTVVHPNYEIGRIRNFYLKKVKFAGQTFHDRLTQILDEFPTLDVSSLFNRFKEIVIIYYEKNQLRHISFFLS